MCPLTVLQYATVPCLVLTQVAKEGPLRQSSEARLESTLVVMLNRM